MCGLHLLSYLWARLWHRSLWISYQIMNWKHHFLQYKSCVLLCDNTYRVGWAGVSQAAREGWRCGSERSCSASCSSYRRTPELWLLCCWTEVAPPSQWWATGPGSWLSSDCAKAWFGNVWLLGGTHRGKREVQRIGCAIIPKILNVLFIYSACRNKWMYYGTKLICSKYLIAKSFLTTEVTKFGTS